jgi:hypothetical protein
MPAGAPGNPTLVSPVRIGDCPMTNAARLAVPRGWQHQPANTAPSRPMRSMLGVFGPSGTRPSAGLTHRAWCDQARAGAHGPIGAGAIIPGGNRARRPSSPRPDRTEPGPSTDREGRRRASGRSCQVRASGAGSACSIRSTYRAIRSTHASRC